MSTSTTEPQCPHGAEILAHAVKLGVKNPTLKYAGVYGWMLCGEGKSKRRGDAWARPTIWQVADDCNLTTGGGSSNEIQIAPQNFKAPQTANKQ